MIQKLFVFKNHAENGSKKLVRDLFLFFKKALYEIKSSGLQFSFQYISIDLNLAYNKNQLYKTLDCWSRDMLNFDFIEKGLRIVSPPHFLHDLSKKKIILMFYSINWPNFIVWWPLFLDILVNMCIAVKSVNHVATS